MNETYSIDFIVIIKQGSWLLLVFQFLVFLELKQKIDAKHHDNFFITIGHRHKQCQDQH